MHLTVTSLQCQCLSWFMIERGNLWKPKPTKSLTPIKKETTIERGNPLDSEIPEWLQEFREILVDDEIPLQGGSHASSSHEVSFELTTKRREDLGKHSVYTHFPKAEIARSARGPKSQGHRAEDAMAESYLVQKILVIWLQQITRFSVKIVNLETITDMQSWCRTWPLNGSSRIRVKQKVHRKHRESCKKTWSQIGSLKSFTLTFPKACEDLSWNHCTLTPHRSETNGIAERAVRRVKEGTSAVLWQSGLDEKWWADSMECYTYLRNVTDLLSDGKTPYERRFGQQFKGPIIPFGSLVEYHPITAKYQSRIHQFGKKVLPGLFLGYALYAGGIWKGDVLVADLEELETVDASEIYSERLNAKKVIFPKEKGEFIFHSQMDESNPLEEIKPWEHPPRYGSDQFKEKVTLIFLENQKGLFHNLTTHFRLPVKLWTIFGPCQETSFSAITLNPESNFTRREYNHSLFHGNTLMYPELLIRIWMSSKRNASMIIGISMGLETCRILGQVSLDLLSWKKNLQTEKCGPGRG